MNDGKTVTACIIVIGNEILSGRTRDINIQFLAGELAALGIRVAEARIIPDITAIIVAAVNQARAAHDYVFTTGGIGPTHDDITAAAIARAFGVALERNGDAEALLRTHYKPEDVNAARLTMADIPAGAELIENPVSRAPGFVIGNVFVLAGVPMIAQAMFANLKHRLVGGAPVAAITLTADVQEGRMAAPLGELAVRFPDLDLGSYPFFRDGKLGVSIVVRGTGRAQLELAAGLVEAAMRDLGGVPAVARKFP